MRTRYTTDIAGVGLVDVYPVGIVRDLLDKPPRLAWFWFRRDWRRRSYWNGWLAEPHRWPQGLQKCGRGWLPWLAERSLWRRVAAALEVEP